MNTANESAADNDLAFCFDSILAFCFVRCMTSTDKAIMAVAIFVAAYLLLDGVTHALRILQAAP